MSIKASEVFISIFWVLFVGLLINGCVHSFKKHKDDPGWLQESPLVLYRGVEYFWHDDFADVKWDERIPDDIGTACALANLSTEQTNIDETKSEIRVFSDKIAKYPTEKKEKIKIAVQCFMHYYLDMISDFRNYLVDASNKKIVRDFSPSPLTNNKYDSLFSYYNFVEIKKSKQEFDSLYSNPQVDSSIRNFDTEKLLDYIDKNKAVIADLKMQYELVYTKLFKEKITL